LSTGAFATIDDVPDITTAQDLRDLYGQPFDGAISKEIDYLDSHCRRFIALSPFVIVASSDAAGTCDASPKGGPPGFVAVLDDHHLAIPDARGNRRLDSLQNMLENPQVGLLFLVPGMGESLRVNGSVSLTQAPDVMHRVPHDGPAPTLALVVRASDVYLHCAKSIIRSGLWRPDLWSDRANLPSAAEILSAHSGSGTPESTAAGLAESYANEL
jgi:PPOX class probable FMN-dependent enzyme